MALGTLTALKNGGYNEGNKKIRIYDVQLTSGANYTTGGESITAASVGLKNIMAANATGLATTTSGSTSRSVSFIYQSDGSVKMQVQTTASAEAASNSDQSTFTIRIKFLGY